MKKHLSRGLALLLAVVMVLGLLPAMAFATEAGEGAGLINGLPADGTYGVIYSCGEGYSYVMGYDIVNGDASVKAVELTEDGESIKELPEGTAIIRFLKNDDGTYYFLLGSKYLVLKDLDDNNKEKLVLSDTAEKGAKWSIIADQAKMEGAYNILNAEYKWNSRYDVYLEQYNGQKFCGYSYGTTVKHFQFKFFATSADEDGRIGEIKVAAAKPVNGDKVVIYNGAAGAVFGQQTAPDAAKQNLTAAAAKLSADATLAYDDISDGGLIFDVTVTGTGDDAVYTFKTGDYYLGMTMNYMDEASGSKPVNDESLILIPTADMTKTDEVDSKKTWADYTKWTMSQINGGWLMKNVQAVWKGYPVYIEFFNDLFAGYSYNSSTPEIFAMNFYKVEDKYNTGYVVNPSAEVTQFAPAIGSDCLVKFAVNDVSELTKVEVKYGFGDGAYKDAVAEMSGKEGSFTIPAAELEGKTGAEVVVVITDALGLTYEVSKIVEVKDEPLILAVSPEPNSATGEAVRRPEISVTFANAGTDPAIVLTVDKETVKHTVSGDKITYTASKDMSLEKHTVDVTITRQDGKSVSKTWSFFVGEGGETLYFGQIHAHTAEYSDGAGTLEQAYEHAQGVADMDFIIVTDHSNYFDTTKTATTSSYYDLSSLSKTAEGTMTKWEEARATAKEYNEKYSDFLCIYGYEMTWSGGPGHTNSFNTYGVVSRNNSALNNKANYAGMHLYNDLMANANVGKDVDGKEASITRNGETVTGVNATKYIPFDAEGNDVPVVSQFNHPGITFGNFDNYAGYTATRDGILNLIEVGNGEGKVGGSAYFPSYSEYDLCLSMGWHVGPTNNQDNHKGNWGDSNTCRDVILTDDFSEIGVYRALAARRIYATEDQNLEIYYSMVIDGEEYKLGDIVDASTVENVTAKISVNDPEGEALSSVSIIGEGGKVLYSEEVKGASYNKEITLKNDNAYYYVKVVNSAGKIAVTAPVWTKESVPVSVSVETDSAVAAQGVEENVTATFLNGSESEDMVITAYTIQAEGKSIKIGKNLNQTVKAGTEFKVTVPFTPSVSKTEETNRYEIKAIFQYEYKGEKDKRSASITETSYPASKMTYIAIDNGHKNFYVSGDYANNEASFIQICADNGIIAEYIKSGEMTKDNLLKADGTPKYKLIVLTVPRIDETTVPPVWTEDELDAIKAYAAAGGNLINLSKSDRYDYSEMVDGKDTYKYASANISNLINEAVGAKARFVRGIVVDNDMKANEAYRIYFKGKELVNSTHPFTQAIVTPSNGDGYQWYNGTGITGGEGVTTLIAPYASSWVAVYKDNFTGSAYVPDYEKDTVAAKKGEFSLVTYEELSGGGFLVCAGAAFISSYDLKTNTPAAQQYENYGMVLNILEYVKNGGVVQEKITPIKDVHAYGEKNGEAKATGKEFTIEGWVTSNASDYDADTAFFDCIYVQDETRGINAFPVSGNYFIGEKVRCHGAISYYCGEIELNLKPEYNGYIKVISDELNVLEPAKVSSKVAMSDANIGNLMQISGTVKDIHRTAGVVDYIYVDDGSGTVGCLFINAYIQKEYKGLDDIEVGMSVTGVGIGSRDVDETGTYKDGIIRRLRVRNREEVIVFNDPCAKMKDVNRSAWYHTAVDYVMEAGLMSGTSSTTFAPGGVVSRAMVASILYRMAGSPTVEYKGTFTDVSDKQWYTKAIEWCAQNGLASGRGNGKYVPNGSVTRQELASFMFRAAKYLGYDTSAAAELSTYPDERSVSDWAKAAMTWAVGLSVITGRAEKTGTYLRPAQTATRAELASILMRLMKSFDKTENRNDLVILYTNDVHCGVDQSMTSIGIAGLAKYKKEMEALHNNVALVDAGDAIQGELIGTISRGDYIVDLMNYVGYDFAALGNHEFDFTMPQLKKLVDKAEYQYLAANFQYVGPGGSDSVVDLDAYKVVDYDGLKIAYVGVVTPESLVKSTPTYFMDADGNWIYSFNNGGNGQELYESVQKAVDAAREEGADVVVALAHLGIDEQSAPWRSTDLIRNTSGIDVVLDGHSHSTIESQKVENKDGEEVILTSTGTKLANIGKLTVSPTGEVKTELIPWSDFDIHKDSDDKLVKNEDEETAAYLAEINAKFETLKQTVVAHTTYDLVIADPDTMTEENPNGVRQVRMRETNLGDVCADAYRIGLGADIAFVNGGGVRDNVKAGDVTYEGIVKVHPFGNEACMVKATGQQILDALEMSARNVKMDAEGNLSGENGGFLQVSGLHFTINTAIASTVVLDTASMFDHVEGARRVTDVEVLQADGSYLPLDPAGTYTLASHNYMLKEGGDGLNMFMKNEFVIQGGKLDNQVLIEYMTSEEFAKHDYTNWKGEGRITIINEACTHADTSVVNAKEATCTEAGYTGDTVCNVCGKTISTGTEIPMIDHVDADGDGKCDVCGNLMKEAVYKLATELKSGDQVILYNAGNSIAVPAVMKGDYYLDGVSLTAEEGVIKTEDTTVVWTVTVNEDGSYTFRNGEAVLAVGLSSEKKTSLGLTETDKSIKWTAELLNEKTSTYILYATELKGNYDHIYLEWYAKYSDFSAYDTSADRVTEAVFGFQFFVAQ